MFAHFCCHCCGCHFHSGYVFIIAPALFALFLFFFFCSLSAPCGNIFNLPNGTVSQVKAIPMHGVVGCVSVWHVACGKRETTAGILIILMRAWRVMHGNRYPLACQSNDLRRQSRARARAGAGSHFRFRRMQTGRPADSQWILHIIALISGNHTANLMRIIHGILPTLHFGL